MSFKDKHALETLPKTIAALQAEADALQAKLDDPQFYARDRTGFEKVSAALGELQQKIAAAEEQWLELEILREEHRRRLTASGRTQSKTPASRRAFCGLTCGRAHACGCGSIGAGLRAAGAALPAGGTAERARRRAARSPTRGSAACRRAGP